MKGELPLRLIVRRPLAGVTYRVQRGRSELLSPDEEREDSLAFQFSVRVVLEAGEEPNFLGEYAQGPKGGRFVYLNSGKHAGQKDTCWDRRAKVPLTGISSSLIKEVLKDGRTLEATIHGAGGDGGPVCGTVSPPERVWRASQ